LEQEAFNLKEYSTNLGNPKILKIFVQTIHARLVFATNQIKALVTIEDVHLAQAINYLEAYDLQTGLLINFGARSLQFKRVFNKSWQS
jgi:GxxExxY protein